MAEFFLIDIDSFSKGPVSFQNFHFSIGAESVIGLTGANGLGKTTLLKLMAGIDFFCGSRLLDEQKLDGLTPGIQLIKVKDNLLPWMSVLANVRFAAIDDTEESATEALLRLGIEAIAGRWPAHLSAGETRLVELARCLVHMPKVLLLDELFSGLDISNREEVKELIKSRFNGSVKSVVLVSHDITILEECCDSTYVMYRQDGVCLLEQGGTTRQEIISTLQRRLGN